MKYHLRLQQSHQVDSHGHIAVHMKTLLPEPRGCEIGTALLQQEGLQCCAPDLHWTMCSKRHTCITMAASRQPHSGEHTNSGNKTHEVLYGVKSGRGDADVVKFFLCKTRRRLKLDSISSPQKHSIKEEREHSGVGAGTQEQRTIPHCDRN